MTTRTLGILWRDLGLRKSARSGRRRAGSQFGDLLVNAAPCILLHDQLPTRECAILIERRSFQESHALAGEIVRAIAAEEPLLVAGRDAISSERRRYDRNGVSERLENL